MRWSAGKKAKSWRVRSHKLDTVSMLQGWLHVHIFEALAVFGLCLAVFGSLFEALAVLGRHAMSTDDGYYHCEGLMHLRLLSLDTIICIDVCIAQDSTFQTQGDGHIIASTRLYFSNSV